MNDRELLEMAAKAAGIRGRFTENHPEDGAPCYSSGINVGQRVQILWNPLTDDRDALRLAVALGMNLEITDSDVYACSRGNFSEPAKPDPCAALRRAIVRAAAEIGRSMP